MTYWHIATHDLWRKEYEELETEESKKEWENNIIAEQEEIKDGGFRELQLFRLSSICLYVV